MGRILTTNWPNRTISKHKATSLYSANTTLEMVERCTPVPKEKRKKHCPISQWHQKRRGRSIAPSVSGIKREEEEALPHQSVASKEKRKKHCPISQWHQKRRGRSIAPSVSGIKREEEEALPHQSVASKEKREALPHQSVASKEKRKKHCPISQWHQKRRGRSTAPSVSGIKREEEEALPHQSVASKEKRKKHCPISQWHQLTIMSRVSILSKSAITFSILASQLKPL